MCDFLRAKRCLAWIFHYARSGAAGDCVRYNLFTKKIRHGLIFRIVDFSVYKFAFVAHNRGFRARMFVRIIPSYYCFKIKLIDTQECSGESSKERIIPQVKRKD